MALADAAVGIHKTIQQMLLERELTRLGVNPAQLAQHKLRRDDEDFALRKQEYEQRAKQFDVNQARQGRLDEEASQQKAATEATSLGDQLPPGLFIPEQDPAVTMLQRGGRGALLTPSDRQQPAGEDFVGPLQPGESAPEGQTVLKRGFLKTRSQKQVDTDEDNRRQQAQIESASEDRRAGFANSRAIADQASADRQSAAEDRRAAALQSSEDRRFIANQSSADRRAATAAAHPAADGAQQQNEVQDSLDLIDEIAKDPALSTAVGPLDSRGLGYVRDVNGVTRFSNRHNELLGKLSLAQAGKLKGQGQISNYERQLLQNAASALSRNLSEEDYKNELAKIRQQFQRMQTGGRGGLVPMLAPDGRRLMVPPEKVGEMEAAGAKRQ